MLRRTLSAGTAALLVAALGLTHVSGATAGPKPVAADDRGVTITVIKVRAAGTRRAEDVLTVDSKLEALRPSIEQLALKYAAYSHEGTVTRDVAWGEPIRMPITDRGGRLDVSAQLSKEKPGHVVLHVAETAPGDEEACMTMTYPGRAGRHVVAYCGGILEDGTLLFFVSAEPRKR